MKTGTKKINCRSMWMGGLAVLCVGSCGFGQVVRLSDKAVVVAGQDVLLGNIATISGTDAATANALANTVVLPALSSAKTVRAESVLMAVIAQLGAEKVASQLQLSGSASCDITVSSGSARAAATDVAAPAPVAAATGASTVANGSISIESAEPAAAPMVTASVVSDAGAGPSVQAADEASPVAAASPTLQEAITDRLAHELKLSTGDFRVNIESDNPLVHAPAPDGGRWQLRPLTRTFVGTVMWEVTAVSGTKVTQRLTLESLVERREMLLVAAQDLDRGEPVTKDSYTVEEVWLDRNLPTLLTNEKEVLGLAPQRMISAGERLDKRDFKPLLLAQRGDSVTVVFMSGALNVRMTAQAMQDGKMHDSIELQNESTHEKYQAVLIGKKLAVVGNPLTDAQEKVLRESL